MRQFHEQIDQRRSRCQRVACKARQCIGSVVDDSILMVLTSVFQQIDALLMAVMEDIIGDIDQRSAMVTLRMQLESYRKRGGTCCLPLV